MNKNIPTDRDEYFQRLWLAFESYVPDLMKMGLAENRLTPKEEFYGRLDYITVVQMQYLDVWFTDWIAKFHKPWKKIRNENSETTWASYENLNFGEEFAEIKELNERAKAALEAFNCDKNFFLKTKIPKRVKHERREAAEGEVDGKTDSGSGEGNSPSS